MEAAASSLSSLLATLRVVGPWTPPATWESVTQAGGAARTANPGGRLRGDPIYELASVPDASLVRLALHALHGVKSSLDEIEELSVLFFSCPADRTSHRVANVWSRSSSTTSVGNILKSIRTTGLSVLFLCKFLHFYLFQSRELNGRGREGHEHEVSDSEETEQPAPYSLVNQAFAAAVEKVLEGYFCSLNTLPASIKLRRLEGQPDIPSMTPDGASYNSNSEITLLEVYLHTEELRRHIKSLGNICFPKFAGLSLCQEGLTTDSNLGFENFPWSTDLLSYLYVHLRDADSVHYGLLKYLFVRSCEPYCNFIKSWIYRASVDDPYEEFLITQAKNKRTQGGSSDPVDNFTLLSLKGANHVSAPCFLKDVCGPLLRTGQQLQVLMKLLESCNLSDTGGDAHASRHIIHLEEILPWFDTSIESSMNSFTFSKSRVEAVICQRDAMYKSMIEKLHHFFSNVEVIPFDAALNVLHISTSPLDTAVSDVELFYHGTNALPACNVVAELKDNDASSTSQESSDKVDALESSESSSSYSSIDDIEDEIDTACDNMPSSMFSSYRASSGEAKCSSVTTKLLSYETCSVSDGINPASPINENKKKDDLSYGHVPMHSQSIEHDVVCDALELDNQYSEFWPFDSFLKNSFDISSGKMSLAEEFLYTGDKGAEQVSHANVVCRHSESGSPRLPNRDNDEKSSNIKQPWNTNIPYNFSINPIVKNAVSCHTEHDLHGNRKNQALIGFNFESVTNPCEAYCGRSTSSLDEFEVRSAMAVQSNAQASKQFDCSSKLLQSKTTSHAYLTSPGDISAQTNLLENPSGGAFWEKSLEYTAKSMEIAGDTTSSSDMPLDIAIDNFTMKLLEDGFDLCGHLQALRRYHFMELADWADSFIVSIYKKKWSFVKSEHKRAEIQGLLDLALQRSSCDSDPYKERLFVYMNEQPVVSLKASTCGLDVLDDILLGYKVDWPVNIVITEEALKTYAEIFRYLVQVRLAVFSLTEVWRFLKELTQLISRSSHNRPDVLKELSSVMKLRHQVYHFLSTLQQYLHCHLSDISWRRFQHSLQHQVRDMLDLEYVHLCYVTDALHICFLSAETKPIAAIINSILQQALELRSCFKSLNYISESTVKQLNLDSLINFSQVDAIRTKFEGNIKDLYILHLKSSKYGEIGLYRFWGYLNYNEYHSLMINKDMGCFYF
uniref:Gamma-tubulin complex component n=1 Tax=Oryza rufipogon TaxID=4529 RepID=A0A0E0PCS8_ORYRU